MIFVVIKSTRIWFNAVDVEILYYNTSEKICEEYCKYLESNEKNFLTSYYVEGVYELNENNKSKC
jgi:hypothetical protein